MTIKRTLHRGLAAVTAAVVAAALLQATPTKPAEAQAKPPKPQVGASIKGGVVKKITAKPPVMPQSSPKVPVWPTEGTSVLDGSSANRRASSAGATAKVLDRATAERAGRDVVVRVAGSGAAVPIKIDYTAFASAYGADWASRLRLVSLPECALATPSASTCAAVPLITSNDGKSVTARAKAGLVALAAGPSSGSGDYSATSLGSSAAWAAGSSSGSFTWSYPMRVPPSLGGPAPGLSLDYSSQAVDGRTSASNNQPSWIGEGFDYQPGFIERRYVACSEDNDDKARPGNNSAESGDQCWGTDNATLSLNGIGGGELIYNATENRWHTRSDDGVRIERFYDGDNGDRGPAGSGAGAVGERWVVTATNGTKYYFGLNKLPGHSGTAAVTNSVYTVPVAGNQAGEPCRNTAFKDSFCVQAWRWNLDWVVDTNGNAASYWYTPETNKYGRNNTATDVLTYTRGGTLRRIDYGQVSSNAYATAPMSVAFDTADRCKSSCTETKNWEDTPLDQECSGATCKDQLAPTFWSKRRLTTITTRVWNTAVSPAKYRDVDRWTFDHSWPDNGDDTRDGMWLDKISHTGWDIDGAATSIPDITLTGVAMDNRVDTRLSNGLLSMPWFRMKTITTESGGLIDVNYLPADCVAGSTPDPATNTKRCFPVRWAPPDLGGAPGKEITDWFHKYVVESVRESDKTSEAQGFPLSTLTSYKYDSPAWRYADDDGLTKDKFRTWSQWRGYSLVSVLKGEGAEQTRVDTRYFRGMDGDRANRDGTQLKPPVVIEDSKKKAKIADADDLNGVVRETISYNGPTDRYPIAGTISDPWLGPITATHTIDKEKVNARYVDTAGVWNWAVLDGDRGESWTHSETSFDSYGMPTAVTEHGDISRTGDEKCALTDYARDDAKWLIAFPYQVRTFALTCAEATKAGRVITADEVIGATRNSYDGKAAGAAPTVGLVTATESVENWTGNKPVYFTTGTTTYDAHGRPRTSKDAEGQLTETTYTPATGGPVTRVDAKNPLGWTSYTEVDPGTGATTGSVDANGFKTVTQYDGLGRLIAAWKPGRTKDVAPNVRYTYKVLRDQASFVQTDELNASGGITTSFAFFDSLLRLVQTQTPAATTGLMVSETFYDTAGRANYSYGPFWDADRAPSNKRWKPVGPAGRDEVPTWSRTLFDGAGRVTDMIQFSKLTEKWRTTTVHGGDHTSVIPPDGGIVEATYVDPLGRTTEIRQFKGNEPKGDYDSTTFTYNRKGQLETVINPMKTVWKYGYDFQGRQTTVDDPDKGSATSTFDKLGRLLNTKDAKGQVLAYEYDKIGRKTGLFAGSTTGRKLAGWEYDGLAKGLGLLHKSSRYLEGVAEPYTSATLSLDAKTGLPLKTAITIPGNEKGLAATYEYGVRYAPDGTPSSQNLPAIGKEAGLGGEIITQGFNSLGMPTWVGTTIGSDLVPAVQFTEFGEPSITYLQNSGGKKLITQNRYQEGTRRLEGIQVDREISPTTVWAKSYQYNQAGNTIRTKESSTVAGAETQCWRQDHLQRLTDAWTPADGNCDIDPSVDRLADTSTSPAPYWTSWTINAGGDRTQQVEHRTDVGVRTTDYTYPAPTDAHPHFATGTKVTGSAGTSAIANYTTDELGNTTSRPTAKNGQQTLTWDIEGHLAKVKDNSGETEYVYDADGNRLISKDAAGKTLYLPGQELRVDNNGTVQSCTRYYTYGGSTIAQRTTAGLTWLIADAQNTASVSVNAETQQATVRRLTAYGEERDTNSAWINDKGFLGKTVDPTGLVHIGAREYDARLGRFISVDPIMDVADPQQMQGYSYANNSPVSFSDPTGLMIINDGGGSYVPPPPSPSPPTEKKNNGGSGGSGGGSSGHKSGDHQQNDCAKSWWCKSKKWVRNHKADIAAFAVGAVVGVGCGFAIGWTGVGAVACGALAGVAGSITHDLVEGGHSVGDMAMNAVVSGVIGGVTGGLFSMGGAALNAGVRTLISKGAAPALKAAGNAARGEGKAIADGLTKGFRGNPKAASQGGGESCLIHSFSPATLVLLADGTTKPISNVEVGDEVAATDPESGESTGQKVVDTHTNYDADLTDLAIRTLDGGQQILDTTQHHPFWSVTRSAWIDASDLVPGELLHTIDGSTAVVEFVDSFPGGSVMHDLTVETVHTYYVLAGNTSVLVHNCGGSPAFKDDPYHPDEVQKRIDAGRQAWATIPREVHGTVNGIESGAVTQRVTNAGPDWFLANGNTRSPWRGATIFTGVGSATTQTRVLVRSDGVIGFVTGHNYSKITEYGYAKLPQRYVAPPQGWG